MSPFDGMEWRRCERRLPRVPRLALVAAAVWLLLVLVVAIGQRAAGETFSTCLVRNVTGIPCPTCGSTRVGLHLLRGDVLSAVRQNPMVMLLGGLGVGWLVARLGFKRQASMNWGTNRVRVAWAVAVLLFVANWAYVVALDRV